MDMSLEHLPAAGAPQQLILLLHGWGGNGRQLAPLAQALRRQFPQAAVLAPDAPHPADRPDRPGRTDPSALPDSPDSPDPGQRQWYSIDGLTEANWPQRVATVLPALHQWVQAQQQRLGVDRAATCLGGFSQGAILSLALASSDDGLCGRVLAFGGRYAEAPLAAPRHTTVHLFHGGADRVIPAQGSRDALEHLAALRGDATLDIAEGVGHELHPALIDCALHRLTSHIPLRTWQAAMGASAGQPGIED
jgi:phospholipase/carboxylesterase